MTKTTSIAIIILLGITQFANSTQANWTWNNPNALVTETGDLKYAPKPFVFEHGDSLKYIDYENGSDKNLGTRDAPFKHHPWDKKATLNAKACKGINTYVFKSGVTYRGALQVRENGLLNNPIRLTCDPTWGTKTAYGAILSGAERVKGWQKGSTHKNIPNGENVWFADIKFNPRSLWMVNKNGESFRIPLARTPNWKVSSEDDVKSEWFTWDNPGKGFGHKDGNYHKAYDSKNIDKPADYYKDAVMWTEWGWVMGTPFPTYVRNVDSEKKWLSFRGQWGGPTGEIISNNRYYLEDKPNYLDDPDGEFWFEKKGNKGGRLYLIVPNNMNPNSTQIEAANHFNLIEAQKMNNIEISGLTFRFSNTFWDLTAMPFANKDVDSACIRLLGSGENITIKNCRFEDVTLALRVKAIDFGDTINNIVFTDNTVRNTDHGGILLEDGGGWGKKDLEIGRLLDVKILRNKFEYIGMRPNRFVQGHCLVVDSAETLEIAGNFLNRCYGSGIHVFGAKRSALQADRPLSRILIHHNKVVDSMLNSNDWGGIETWQGGPVYVYSNISGNPGGYWHWKFKNHPKEPGCARFGHAYYLDGAFKNYHFNNIAWGKSKDPLSPLGNTSAFQEIHSYQNTFFNNTVYNFVIGSRRQAPQAGRNKYLSNIWDAIGHRVFRHANPAKTMAEANAKDAGEQGEHFDYTSNAYTKNIFHDVAQYGVYEANGKWLSSMKDFQDALLKHKSMLSDVGTETPETPLMNPAQHDFRLKPNSAAIDKGSKVFVPWSLYAMVGEWNFYHTGDDPTNIIDEHWYMTPYYTDRTDYHNKPMFPLKGVNISKENYVQGELEDWIDGALKLNGKNQYAFIENSKLNWKDKKPEVVAEIKNETFDWVEVDAPKTMVAGKPSEITLTLNGIPDGNTIQIDLHWIKKGNAWGGVNTVGQRHTVKGNGPYTFKIKPVDKPQLTTFDLIIYTSKDGTWANKTNLGHYKIPATDATPEQAKDFKSPQIKQSNFILEAYFKTTDNKKAVLLEKMKNSGYSLLTTDAGNLSFTVKAKKQAEIDNKKNQPTADTATLTSKTKINDGKWHHVIAECDRDSKKMILYIDGKIDSTADGIGNSDISNNGDLYVGGTPSGRCLNGTIDFIRISQGTLADAKTTIEELYAWQFNGPFLKDFTGRAPTGVRRDAGALEAK
jgi:hypothetical protein